MNSRELPVAMKLKAYDIFLDPYFMEEVTYVVRDYLIATWMMESQYVEQVKNKLLSDPISELLAKKLSLEFRIKVTSQDVSTIVRQILLPFFNAENNDRLYEEILYKWWELYLTKSDISRWMRSKNKSYFVTNISKNTVKAVGLINGLPTDQKNDMHNKLWDKKINFLHEVTGEYPDPSKVIIISKSRIKSVFNILVFSLVEAVFLNCSKETFFYIALFNIIMGFLVLKLAHTPYIINNFRLDSYEATGLTNYFISDRIINSIQSILAAALLAQNAKSSSTDLKKSPKQITSMKVDTSYSYLDKSLHEPNESNYKKIATTQTKFIGIRNDNYNKIVKEIGHCNYIIKWEDKLNQSYSYNSLKACNVVQLHSRNASVNLACRHDYVVADESIWDDLTPNQEIKKEFLHLLKEALVVPPKKFSGLVKYQRKDEAFYKVKTLKSGYSHYRGHCHLWGQVSMTENVKGKPQTVTKSLYMPFKVTNK